MARVEDVIKPIPARPISQEEVELLSKVLLKAAIRPDSQTHLAKLAELNVVGVCECGCGSLYFQPSEPGCQMIADGGARFRNGKPAQVMLWACDGRVSLLEIVDWDEVGGLPDPASVCSWEESGQ